jgi:prevent-host-death family protein
MKIAVSEAKAKLTDLVRRAEAGEDVVLTRNGEPTARIIPFKVKLTDEERWARIRELQREAAKNLKPGPCAARAADFLYDEFGLPA